MWDHTRTFTDLSLIREIELRYASFCQILIKDLLHPYWDKDRVTRVETYSGRKSR